MAKSNIISRLQNWMDSKSGQMFLNYAYSWGASIVILGALFKLTHMSGADIMLFIGMGTEVIVFFLSGFERTYDTIEDDAVIEARQEAEDRAAEAEAGNTAPSVVGLGGGTIIVGGGVPVSGVSQGQASVTATQGQPGVSSQSVNENEEVASGAAQTAAINPATLADAIAASSAINIPAQFNGMTPEMEEATNAYVEQVKELTEVLRKVAEQSQRLTRDSEEMENMNRTLTGINSLYEIQLRSVSSQVGTIDDINAQTKRLAEQIEELNAVYARMLEALKMNMKA